jgi:hypothetical protein
MFRSVKPDSEKFNKIKQIGIKDIANSMSNTPQYKKNVSWLQSLYLKSPEIIVSDENKIKHFPYGKEHPGIYRSGLTAINLANEYNKDYGATQEAKNQYDTYNKNTLGGKTKKSKKRSKTKKSKFTRRLKNKTK